MRDKDWQLALLGEETISSKLAEQKIHVGALTQKVALPAIFAEIDGDKKPASAGKSAITEGGAKLTILGAQRANTVQLEKAVTAMLEGFNGPFGEVSVTGMTVAGIDRTYVKKAKRHVHTVSVEFFQNKPDPA